METIANSQKRSQIKRATKAKTEKENSEAVTRGMAPTPKTPTSHDWKATVLGHLGLATTLAKEYKNIPGVDFDDILQQARIGLTRAAMSFDERKGTAFSTYAWRVIQNDLNTFYSRQRRRMLREQTPFEDYHHDSSKEFQSPEELMPDETADVHTQISLRESQEAIRRAMVKLPLRLRRVIEGILHGQDYRKIGKDLGFSHASAKTLVSRSYHQSLKLLKMELEKNGFIEQTQEYPAVLLRG